MSGYPPCHKCARPMIPVGYGDIQTGWECHCDEPDHHECELCGNEVDPHEFGNGTAYCGHCKGLVACRLVKGVAA